MTTAELNEVVEQRMADPAVVGRLACNLRSGEMQQRHLDDKTLRMEWIDSGDSWRCVVTDAAGGKRVAQVDIHENSTVRMEAYEPCRIAVCPEDGILTLTRYRPV